MAYRISHKAYLCALMCATASVGSLAQGSEAAPAPTVYTLEECVNEAVRNNLNIRKAERQIEASGEQRKEAYTKYFPSVSASALGFASNKGLVQMDLGGGLAMSLLKHGYTGSITAMQPVYAGGQIVAANKLAKVGEDVARLQRRLTENEVRYSTEHYYWQAVMLKEKLKTLGQVDRQLAEVRKDAQAAVDAGIKNRNDLLQVELRINEVQASRIEAENALTAVCDMLAQVMAHAGERIDVCELLGEPGVGDTALTSVLPENPSPLFVAPDDALSRTNEYQLLDKQLESDELQYRISVGKNLPSVAVGAGYVYSHLMDKSQNNVVGMLSVSVPISSWWGGTHEMKRRKLEIANDRDYKQCQSELLVIRMRKAWNDLNDAYKQIGIAQKSITQSKENLRLNVDYYQVGMSTISDLLDAQTLYQQSRDRLVESVANYQVKKREYMQATGR